MYVGSIAIWKYMLAAMTFDKHTCSNNYVLERTHFPEGRFILGQRGQAEDT